MVVQYFRFLSALVREDLVIDDFGNVIRNVDVCTSITARHSTMNAAKRHLTGFSFEEAGFVSILPVNEEH